jgi:hypothetical protein
LGCLVKYEVLDVNFTDITYSSECVPASLAYTCRLHTDVLGGSGHMCTASPYSMPCKPLSDAFVLASVTCVDVAAALLGYSMVFFLGFGVCTPHGLSWWRRSSSLA